MSDSANKSAKAVPGLEKLPKSLVQIDGNESAKFRELFAAKGIMNAKPRLFSMRAAGDGEFLSEKFVLETLNDYVIHAQKFVVAVKQIVAALPLAYQQRLGKAQNVQLRIFSAVLSWNVSPLNAELAKLQSNYKAVTVEQTVPFVFLMYRPIMQILFLSEDDFGKIMDETFMDVRDRVSVPVKQLAHIFTEAKTEWSYHLCNTAQGLYPLLMRMCSAFCVDMQSFLNDHIQRIMHFLSLSREDIILPQPFTPVGEALEDRKSSNSAYAKFTQQIDQKIHEGLKLLDELFPQAGWLSLDKFPDMYPYFQSLFNFHEGLNMIAPQNPIQVAVVLMRIIEDLFSGCMGVRFAATDSDYDAPEQMSLEEINRSISDWYFLRMNVFDKEYIKLLSDYVNRIYSQPDYISSPTGIKKMASIVQLERVEFFPMLKHEFNFMTSEMSSYGAQPVYKRVARLARYFDWLSDNIESARKTGGKAKGLLNAWEQFNFSLDNLMSKRLSRILTRNNPMAADNANLVVSISKILTVLDWWLSDPKSPAYAEQLDVLYRCDENGEPQFSVEPRSGVESLFRG